MSIDRRLTSVALLGTLVVLCGADGTKRRIELPIQRQLAASGSPVATVQNPAPPKPAQLDVRKKFVERSVELVINPSQVLKAVQNVAKETDVERTDEPIQQKLPLRAVSRPSVADTPGKPENPTVQPGAVKWHKDMKEASAASKRSGKPVLLFQMLGNLDDRFC